ncbi:MAG: CBS domain-containing protein [Candidatus Thermoplasmatota archaeon]|jgi:CBS domain-containing protein|nr:CBS domain-containing protein [Candidatus Thermoplasmatota archaeon]
MPITVAEVMTKNPITCFVPSSVEKAVKILTKNNITGMPIVDSEGKYAGVLSRRDIFKNVEETQTAIVMRTPEPIRETDPISKAAKEMVKEGKRHLVVVNESRKVVGIVTPQNLLPEAAKLFGDKKISEIFVDKVIPVWNETPLKVLFNVLRISGTYVFVVIDTEGKMVGLVTDRDIFDKIEFTRNSVSSEGRMDEDEDPWTWTGLKNFVQYAVQKNLVNIPDYNVDSVMIKEPKVSYKNERLSSAISVMLKGNFNQIPIIEGDNKPFGMLYDLNIMRLF